MSPTGRSRPSQPSFQPRQRRAGRDLCLSWLPIEATWRIVGALYRRPPDVRALFTRAIGRIRWESVGTCPYSLVAEEGLEPPTRGL